MILSPDQISYFELFGLQINATILFTWILIGVLIPVCWVLTRGLKIQGDLKKTQVFLEAIVDLIDGQIREVSPKGAEKVFSFIASLFLFIFLSNVLGVVPGFERPTASLSTTLALAACVFLAVPYYGIRERGILKYLQNYIEPNPVMLPFNILGEITRTIALAIRLFGNMMSGSLVAAILLLIVPLFVPVLLELLELLIGVIQAYIFTVLSLVFISSGMTGEAK